MGGGRPPNPPGAWRHYFFVSRLDRERGGVGESVGLRPGDLGLLYFFSSAPNRPRGRGPYFIVGFYDNGGEVLLKREPTGSPGVRGIPGGVFASFCRREQKDVAHRPSLFHALWFSMRSCHKAQPVLWHILSPREERMQRDVRGAPPPNPPRGF